MSTKIQWTDKTWSPVTGCSKISAGCKNCYAEKMTARLQAMGLEKYEHGFKKVVCHSDDLTTHFPGKSKMIFVNSMSDTFHKDVPTEFILDIFDQIRQYPQHIFQVLTKRAERLREIKSYPTNAWVGVTVENSDNIVRIPYLQESNAHIKFLSIEPLLSDISFLPLGNIDWVIVGAESGHNARHCDIKWIRNIKEQCKVANVPIFIKQIQVDGKLVKDINQFPPDLQIREYPI